jgi:hypothetical protein
MVLTARAVVNKRCHSHLKVNSAEVAKAQNEDSSPVPQYAVREWLQTINTAHFRPVLRRVTKRIST